jgi:hypothetical protein
MQTATFHLGAMLRCEKRLLTKDKNCGIVAKAPCVSFCETKSHFRGAASDGVQNGMGGGREIKPRITRIDTDFY